ncbi:XTP/dITP diphosphatase [Paenibacillus alvei]|uniref:dITP/XTP pyrophosphatase n=1 Tax=Paenibacillus alvei TaxID=44250 RepID=A0AAP7A1F7_PAEAL|nr:XTP/dITP diphosphatase [Paenibacillus alvei]MBG9734584.1 purine NTP phosphatase [Paenibacillus alvei]MBG9743105.1 purine NTP phosphatase [Paenibacillus alvei]MCY9579600.1 XTP/dITP diphosphatase [Paenibacillus alvei]MCY9586560.1 XTP/dITP diphosphatase [Paenibacillus alvei]NEZ43818.1 XTP/dITP diphosphatase [Paenibacillus alvei]
MHLASDTIIVATSNQGKLKEFQLAFASLGKRVLSMADYPQLPEVVEDGDTFKANALKKAKEVAEAIQLPVLADDSGLCVERLAGAPGVYSARYAGGHGDTQANNAKLLEELKKLPARRVEHDKLGEASEHVLSAAQFVCCLVLYDPAERQYVDVTGTCDGFILDEARGEHGFGYDPLFYVPAFGKTMAELTPEQKQSISHRGNAIRTLLDVLQKEHSQV